MSKRYVLPRADKDEFDVTWPLFQELSLDLRHFNGLQGHTRKMASTWLLASLAGVGFIYSRDPGLPVETDAAAAFIAGAGAVGIALLWILDVLVYHELLIASDEAAGDLERQHAWIPRARQIYADLHLGRKVRLNISLFYIGSMLLLTLVTAFSLGHLLWARTIQSLAWAASAVVVAVGVGSGLAMYRAAIR